MSLNMFSSELTEQREVVRKECMKFQVIVNKELKDNTFIWHAESNYVHVTFDFFRTKKPREDYVEEDDDDVEVKPKHSILFKVDRSQNSPSFIPESQTDSEVQDHKPLNL
jgi:hypothetical protein